MLFVRRLLLVLALAALLCSIAFVTGYALSGRGASSAADPGPASLVPGRTEPTAAPTPTVTATRTPAPKPSAVTTRTPTPTSTPTLTPGARLLGPGDTGDRVRDLQARLRQIAWFTGDVTGTYGDVTRTAVRGFQAKREIPVTGIVDQRTLDRLGAMTTTPTRAQLTNQVTAGNTPGTLDARCRVGRALCIDKTSRTLRWVVDGKVRQTLDVRFGASYSPTREGLFHVTVKDADHVSRLYGSPMPWSMFFSRGQAVHYSSDFAARGYAGASHGCVNVRDLAGLERLYAQVRVGDKVVVYWS